MEITPAISIGLSESKFDEKLFFLNRRVPAENVKSAEKKSKHCYSEWPLEFSKCFGWQPVELCVVWPSWSASNSPHLTLIGVLEYTQFTIENYLQTPLHREWFIVSLAEMRSFYTILQHHFLAPTPGCFSGSSSFDTIWGYAKWHLKYAFLVNK